VSEERIESDEELVERARQAPEGDLRAFECIVGRYESKILANCRYITRDPAHAEDLAQEVFIKVFYGLKGFEGRSALRTWMQRIKVNHCLNHLKKKEGKTFVDVEDPQVAVAEELSVKPAAERAVSSRDEREIIAEILDSMNDTLRIPLVLREMDQLSYQEIADELGLGLSAVKMRIKRAREEFQARYRTLTGVPEQESTHG
jgi:RNA polymerase sigma-70 factor (ECF subfamily)